MQLMASFSLSRLLCKNILQIKYLRNVWVFRASLGYLCPWEKTSLEHSDGNCQKLQWRGNKIVFLFQTELSDVFLFKHLERTHKAVFQFYLIQQREETPFFTAAAKYFDGTLTT